MTNIENSQNIIIEGCYLLPRLMGDFEESYSDHIVPIFLGFSEEYIRDNYTSAIAVNRSAAEVKDERGLQQEQFKLLRNTKGLQSRNENRIPVH